MPGLLPKPRQMEVKAMRLLIFVLLGGLLSGCATVSWMECDNYCLDKNLVVKGVEVSPPGLFRNWLQVENCICGLPVRDLDCRFTRYCEVGKKCQARNGECKRPQ